MTDKVMDLIDELHEPYMVADVKAAIKAERAAHADTMAAVRSQFAAWWSDWGDYFPDDDGTQDDARDAMSDILADAEPTPDARPGVWLPTKRRMVYGEEAERLQGNKPGQDETT